ncbi:MAG TPA: hypothetical protein VGK24_09655 [Candidatus Angelobacter sp.]|jgi:hypothetical protein
MKKFHISDVLSVTTGRLVSSRHMDGIYKILNFLTGDSLFTHQLPRAMRECEPWLRAQYPYLFPDHPPMAKCLVGLDGLMKLDDGSRADRAKICSEWVKAVQREVKFPEVLPDMLPIEAMARDMHTVIDPIEEAKAMVGEKNVIAVETTDLST